MSRLIIKNLPSYITSDRLKDHFQQTSGPGGTLTDTKVALKKDGSSRRFGFVGYKTDKDADAAKEWFDRTFIDSSRISVSVVEGAKDAPAPRPNKRPRREDVSDSFKPKDEKPSAGEELNRRDDKFEEFAKIMEPRTKKGPSWANEPTDGKPSAVSLETKAKKKTPSASTDVEMRDAGGEAEDKQEGMSDLDWMKKRMKANIDVEEKVFEQEDEEMPDAGPSKPETVTEQDPTKETIMQTSRLFVRNLAFSCTSEELEELFQPFGDISQLVHVPLDATTKQSKGVAYVTFANPACAVEAFEALDRTSFQGRLLHILAAVDRKGRSREEDTQGKNRTVKEDREAKRKAGAGRDFNWGMLYMNSDAVASSIASRMKISKSDILNPESSDNAAVKLALAETHIIQETKTYLESQGVVLSSFSSSSRRSDTVVLVKNIPYGTTAEQIREMFEGFGKLVRVIVPPAGTMAVVEFEFGDEAGRAFKAVAYRRLGNSVIYLEKGPMGMFQDNTADNGGIGEPMTRTGVEPVRIRDKDELLRGEGGVGDAQQQITSGTTLFVKNLAFSTTTERLSEMFRHLPAFSFARVQTKPDLKRAGEKEAGPRLSMGYGFIGFKTVEGARSALKSLNGYALDGHALLVKFAGRGTEGEGVREEKRGGKEGAGSKSKTTTKMIVKNVPFEASKKDIQQLFGAHGQLKSVRLPKKFNSRSRGFAFLDFVSRNEAENAYAALRHTHLLGRHLVLEWAEEGEQDIEVLREKAGVGFGGGKDVPGRKRKLDLGGGDGDPEDLE